MHHIKHRIYMVEQCVGHRAVEQCGGRCMVGWMYTGSMSLSLQTSRVIKEVHVHMHVFSYRHFRGDFPGNTPANVYMYITYSWQTLFVRYTNNLNHSYKQHPISYMYHCAATVCIMTCSCYEIVKKLVNCN